MSAILGFLSALSPLVFLIGGLGIFLFGMKIMSEGIQKRTGRKFQRVLQVMTSRPAAGVVMGASVTAVIQSSSATTVMLVSLVNAGLLTLKQSIGVIMGANIGTTMTAWIVSILGFKFNITGFALFCIAVSLPLYFSKKEKFSDYAHILIGFGLLFLGLHEMKEAVSFIKDNTAFFEFLTHFTQLGPGNYGSYAIFVIIGALLTVVVQSSSAAMTITLAIVYNGWIPFDIAAAIVLGENIGTTITAFLASLQMNTSAKQTARAHMIFNIIGVILMLIFFKPVLSLMDMVPLSRENPDNLPIILSIFHTFFNISNTFILIWFIPYLEKLVKLIVPDKPDEINGPYRVPFISVNVPDQAQANIINAQAEVGKMSILVKSMMNNVKELLDLPLNKVEESVDKITAQEVFADDMNAELNNFLVELSLHSLSEDEAHWVAANLRIIGELESVSDSIKKIAVLFAKHRTKNIEIHKKSIEQILECANKTMEFLQYNTDYLTGNPEGQNIEIAYEMENDIHELKKTLQKKSRKKIKSGGNLKGELLFMEMIRQFELIGEFCINIAQTVQTTF